MMLKGEMDFPNNGTLRKTLSNGTSDEISAMFDALVVNPA
jgi:hypothetical protein